MDRTARLGLDSLAMVMIGDGLITALHPRRHARLWETGPDGLRRTMAWLEARPGLARALGLAEAAFGLWLADRQVRAATRLSRLPG